MAETDAAAVISARGLVKRFGDVTAVDGVDFDIRRGEVFGVLGPNGAGKSTTMRMLGAVSPPTAGTLRVFGLDTATDGVAIRRRLGVCHQSDSLDPEVTVRENLITYARYFGISRARARRRATELLDFVQLGDRADGKVDPLSGGMRRRLAVARTLVNDPEVVLLDEPTTGLDPQARHLVWERLDALRRGGVTLVLTTHYMEEAEQLCDRLVVMDHGRIVAEGAPMSLIEEHITREVVELRPADLTPAEYAREIEGLGERIETLPDRVLVYTDDGDAVLEKLPARRSTRTGVFVRRATLEDVFLRLTGRRLAD
jgi:lipooligosaccharide transport system ATP-binding protein